MQNVATYLRDTVQYDTVDVYTDKTTPGQVTGHGILNTLWELVVQSHQKSLKNVWIHFSGHGTGVTDQNGDETDGQDEAICPVDHLTNGVITDDTIKSMIRYFNKDTQVVCVFDCCHSGTMGDLKYRMDGVMANTKSECWANVVMLSGCRDSQTSADAYNVGGNKQYTGAMTTCLLDCLRYRRQINNGNVTVFKLLKDLRRLLTYREFDQKPVLTSSRPLDNTTPFPI